MRDAESGGEDRSWRWEDVTTNWWHCLAERHGRVDLKLAHGKGLHGAGRLGYAVVWLIFSPFISAFVWVSNIMGLEPNIEERRGLAFQR